MALDRKSASAKRDLQRLFPTFVQKREIFERRTRESKLALKVIFFLSRPIGAVFGLSSLETFSTSVLRLTAVSG